MRAGEAERLTRPHDGMAQIASSIEDLVRRLAQARGFEVHERSTWLVVAPKGIALPAHGWKLHVSSRPGTFLATAEDLVPLLLDERCAFKLAKSEETLSELNDGLAFPQSVGKAFTIYPAPNRVRPLGLWLTELLRGQTGPRVTSDKQIDSSAPVYYRYGAFAARWCADRSGRLGLLIEGPHGEEFDAEAVSRYRQPDWVVDPFTEAGDDPQVDSGLLLGDWYRVIEGVYESGRGNVYRAIDQRDNETVIIKQARAFVSESSQEIDARLRLRNERRVLQAAAGIVGVPACLDHFRHRDDEFLVTTDKGDRSLAVDIQDNGPYGLDGHSQRDARRLAGELARTLASLHGRRILVRDLSAKNIVLGTHQGGHASIVDFGLSHYDSYHIPGGTPGYAPDRQLLLEPPSEGDDYYALGMVLMEALTGLPPVRVDSGDVSRARALETTLALAGRDDGVAAAAMDLVSQDSSVQRAAFAFLCSDRKPYSLSTQVPAPHKTSTEHIARMAGVVLGDVVTAVDRLLEQSHGVERGLRRVDASLYTGIAGVGLELLHHSGWAAVEQRLPPLAQLASDSANETGLGPGLFTGRSGLDIFLAQARPLLGEIELSQRPRECDPSDFDLITGAAGLGLAHLWLHQVDNDPHDLTVARICADALRHAAPSGIGLAHGLAGVVAFRAAMCPYSLDPELVKQVDALLRGAVSLLARASDGDGNPLATVSWCNGLAGVARALIQAGDRLDRPDCISLAAEIGDVCALWISRMTNIGQCCGAVGIGELLIDLWLLTGEHKHHEHALAVAQHLILRSGGSPQRPVIFNLSHDAREIAWAGGLSGILGFLRRLRDRGGPRILPTL